MEKEKSSRRYSLKDSFRMLYEGIIYLLLFEMFYKWLIIVIFKPILEIIVSLFNKDGVSNLLVNTSISKSLLKYSGNVLIVLVMVLSVVFVYYEFSFILLVLDKIKKKEKVQLFQISKKSLINLKGLIKFGNIGLFPYILILIPILNIGIQSFMYPLLSISYLLINGSVKHTASKILSPLLIIGLLFLLAKLFIVLPLMVLNNKNFKDASIISFKNIKKDLFKIMILISIGLFSWIALTYPPFMILENAQYMIPKILRSASNIVIILFTLVISPLMLSLSFLIYNSNEALSITKKEEIREKKQIGNIRNKILYFIEKASKSIQKLISKHKHKKNIFIALILCLVIGVNVYIDEMINPIYERQILIGHRGGEYGVENTIGAVLYAGTNGAEYAEIDVLLTKDNIPVVIHDNNLKRLADTDKKISDMTLAEVNEVTIEKKGNEDYIPSLEELSKEVKGKTKLLVEFKTHDKEKESIVDKSIEVLKEQGILDETIFQTAEEDILEEFNKKYENLTMGYIFKGEIGVFPAERLANMEADFISVKQAVINKNMIKEMHKTGKAIFTWTTNSDYKAERILKLGVDGIITDYSVEMVELRDKYKDYYKK